MYGASWLVYHKPTQKEQVGTFLMAKYRDAEFAAWADEQFDWDIEPELLQLDVESISADDEAFEAQRDLDGERAAEMAQHFLPAVAAGVIVAQLPDGRRVFVDGQHRWRAAKDAGEQWVWALVFEMTEAQAAAFFRLRNGPAVRQSSHMDSTIAAQVSTFTPAVELAQVLDKHGCYLDRKRRRLQGAIATSKTAEAIYRVDGGDLLDKTLDVITDCWGRGSVALSAEVLEGMALFLAHWSGQMDAQRQREMRQRFRDEDLDAMVNEALRQWKIYRGTSHKANHIEAQLMFVFNNRRSLHRLPERTPGQLAKLPNLLRLERINRLKQFQPVTA